MLSSASPNDSNISTQHVPTMLAQHLQAPVKRSQHFNATFFSTTCCTRLVTLLQRVATYCELKIELVRMPEHNIVARTWPNDYNVIQHPQRPKDRNMSLPTMLCYVALTCCDRLAGALNSRLFRRGRLRNVQRLLRTCTAMVLLIKPCGVYVSVCL